MTITEDGEKRADEEAKARRELLLKVYDAAVNEYRFNVQLAWDRTKFFLLLNASLIAAGVGLTKFAQDSTPTSVFLVLYFFLCIAITAFGLETIELGKTYYRQAIFTKTLVERELGLLDPMPDAGNLLEANANLSLAVTRGQRDHQNILYGERSADGLRDGSISTGSIVSYARATFWAMIVIEVLGAIIAAVNAANR